MSGVNVGRQPALSAVLAVRDEESMLRPCLELLTFADEIVVVVDARTRDATEEIAREYTPRVHVKTFADFSTQKNYAIDQATSDWVLSIDADERVTPALAQEIAAAIRAPSEYVSFRIPRWHFFFGKRFRHGGWDNDKPIRLVRRGAARFVGEIHEVLTVDGPIGELKAPIWHFTHRNIESMLLKTANFGEVQARELAALTPRVTTSKLFRVLVGEMYSRLLRGRGWRDGFEGVVESLYQPFSLFCVHVMLWERQLQPSLEERYRQLEEQARRAS
jgi:glycosyltransferase involved in cell wall biosynthesis